MDLLVIMLAIALIAAAKAALTAIRGSRTPRLEFLRAI
jgi:hypothetical protein